MNNPQIFKNEREFTIFLKQELEHCQLVFSGFKLGSFVNKKLNARITRVDMIKTKVKMGGKCDVKVYHDGLDLSYDHKLANPFKIEVKMNNTWRDALPQAIRYKYNSENKYELTTEGKNIEIGVTTPDLFFYGTFDKTRCPTTDCKHHTCFDSNFKTLPQCQQFDIKRIFWKVGVALLERELYTNRLQITANEGDKIDVIKKESVNESRGSS